jgi:cell division protein FtsQ
MASIASVSQEQLRARRKQLRRARRIKRFQAIWRSLFVGSMASGLVWAIALPDWVIRQPEQVVVEGNHFLSAGAVRSLLPLSYPQSLWRLEPQAIAESLEAQAPIAEATVSRQLIPPGLIVQVREREPVAVVQTNEAAKASTDDLSPIVGLLDEQGAFIPESSYQSLEVQQELPTLKVIGANEEYRPYWSEIYRAVSQSVVQVFAIDWQDPTNLILKTELGSVHLGPYSSRFSQQLDILGRMEELPAHIDPERIAYIDLKKPELPAIQMQESHDTASPQTH